MHPSPSAPSWLRSIPERLAVQTPSWFLEHPAPAQVRRRSAVLVLFAPNSGAAADQTTVEVILTERAHSLRAHAAQVVCPGGHAEPGETIEQAALRETAEEIDIDPGNINILATLPTVYLAPQQTSLTAVVGWWSKPHPLCVTDTAEVAQVLRPTIAELVDPAQRFIATIDEFGGYRGVAFLIRDLVCWGVTASLLSSVLELAGIDLDWQHAPQRRVPDYLLAPYLR